MPSILDPITCGFAKVRCYNIFTSKSMKCLDGEKLSSRRHEEFCTSFNNFESFRVDMRTFRNFERIVKNMRNLAKTNSTGKAELMRFFSLQNWNGLSLEEKKHHTLFDCLGCSEDLVFKSKLSVFKNCANPFKHKALKNRLSDAADVVNTVLDIAASHETSINKIHHASYREILQTSWKMEALSPAPAAVIDKKMRNKIGKEYQKECEAILAENAVEW